MTNEEKFDELFQVLLGIRSSIDVPFRMGRSTSPERSQALKAALLNIEAVRLDTVSYRVRRDQPIPPEAIVLLRAGLEGFLNDPNFREAVSGIRFRERPPMRDRLPSEYLEEALGITEVVHLALQRLNQADLSNIDDRPSAAALRRVIPDQKLAPVQFDIARGKLVIAKQPAKADAEDTANVDQARDALIKRGESVIDALERSNCDRRVVDGVKELQKLLLERENIIELALLNLGVERICSGAASELPDAVLGALEGHTTGIGMYVAQFPEWRRFSENAASIDLTASDVARIGAAAQSVIDRLEQEPSIADPDVPKTLKALKALISDPANASQRAAFAVLRTVENLVARVYRFGADLLDKTLSKTSDALSTAISVTVVGSLMALALTATTNLGPITGKVAETTWMRTAAQIVKKQIEDLVK